MSASAYLARKSSTRHSGRWTGNMRLSCGAGRGAGGTGCGGKGCGAYQGCVVYLQSMPTEWVCVQHTHNSWRQLAHQLTGTVSAETACVNVCSSSRQQTDSVRRSVAHGRMRVLLLYLLCSQAQVALLRHTVLHWGVKGCNSLGCCVLCIRTLVC